MESIKISIIIVTYNSEKDIYPCLNSIVNSNSKINYEILIVDNDSKDNTCSIITHFMTEKNEINISLYNTENNGFNAGNNVGIKNAKGEYILLLNPDTEISPNALDAFYFGARKINKFGALGCVLKNRNDQEVFSAGYFPSIQTCFRKIFKKSHVKINYDLEFQKVDFPSGATFFFKRAIIKEIGLMDENYFIYYDETDYAYQMRKVGYQNYLLTNISIIHKFGQSTSKIPKFSIEKSIESYFYFIEKNYTKFNGFFLKSFELLICVSRFLASHFIKRNNKSLFKFYLQTYYKSYYDGEKLIKSKIRN